MDVDVHLGTGVEMDMVGRGCVQHWLVYMYVEVCTCGGERHVVSAGGGGGADTVPAPAVRVAPARPVHPFRPASHGAAAARRGQGEVSMYRYVHERARTWDTSRTWTWGSTHEHIRRPAVTPCMARRARSHGQLEIQVSAWRQPL